ncbi:hypothetical protein Hdeb2414_s0009g00321271 [Helianthus debilis subsp. tardiflorus]
MASSGTNQAPANTSASHTPPFLIIGCHHPMVVAYGGYKTNKERGDERERQPRGRTSGCGCDRWSFTRTGGRCFYPAATNREERERNEMKRERVRRNGREPPAAAAPVTETANLRLVWFFW